MKTYSMGEAEAVIGVKAHVLRYWETIVPGIAPQKDESGKRIYTARDIERLSRLKHLIYEKKYTIEGARDALLAEEASSAESPSAARLKLLHQVSGLRAEMLDLYQALKRQPPPEAPPGA
jgi:DNA-binding transcriptional MerR regulator